MANKKYEETDIQAIAEAIREKTGSEDSYKVSDMASGVDEVYEAGKKSEYDAFWDAYQRNGNINSSNYGCAFFGECWNDKTFKPKYDIIFRHVQSAGKAFYRNGVSNIHQKLTERGLKIDIGANVTRVNEMFTHCNTTEVPPLETAHCTDFGYMFASDGRNRMHTIHKINMTNATTATNMFTKQGALKNITFEGEIPISLSFSYSPLTVESLKNIITHLKDYSGTTSEFTYSLTLSSACITALDAEGATSPNSNTWREYATDLGWNIN